MVNKLRKRTTGPSTAELRASMMRHLERRVLFKGDILFPCVPALADDFATRLVGAWATLGRPISSAERDELCRCMRLALAHGYEKSPHGAILVSWEANPSPAGGQISYRIDLQERSLGDRYNDWLKWRSGPLFGALPDTKIMNVAATLGDASQAAVLDVGAGTGRNALALARAGHPTEAVELVAEFCQAMRSSATEESLPLHVLDGDVLSDDLRLEPSRYRLVFASEVLSHFGSADEARALFVKLAEALEPGGLLVFNTFLGKEDYDPDRLARELGYTSFASLFSRQELRFLVDELPFELVSDESAFEFEKANTAAEAWPPTTWFESWSLGSNIFDVPLGKAPVELRWLVYRRK